MQTQVLYLMVIRHLLYFALVTGLHIAKYLQIAKSGSIFKDCAKDHIILIKRKINNKRILRLALEFKAINKVKLRVKYPQQIGA